MGGRHAGIDRQEDPCNPPDDDAPGSGPYGDAGPPLGGVAQYPGVSSGPNVGLLAAVSAAGLAVVLLGGAGWYVRRRLG